MPFTFKAQHALVASLILLFLCRAVLASVIVPPWQGADEPTHFALVDVLALPEDRTSNLAVLADGRFVNPTEQIVHRKILESMAKYRWWEPYGDSTPSPMPTFFFQVGFGSGTYAQPLYYGLGAFALRAMAPGNLEGAYWRLRILSILIAVVTLVVSWAGTRLMFGPAAAVIATAVLALHPQFLLTAISVNPNVLTGLLGAVAWWHIGRVLQRRRPHMSLALVFLAAVCALLTKRSAVPFAVIATAITVWLSVRERNHADILWRRFVPMLVIASLAALLVVIVWSDGLTELLSFWRYPPLGNPPVYEGWLPDKIEHSLRSIDHLWLIAGWSRFEAPVAWRWVARFITIVGMVGSLLLFMQSSADRQRLSIAWLLVIVQVVAVVALAFWGLAVPTGRYADPVLAPMAALLWLGIERILPTGMPRRYAGLLLISTLAILDVTAFTSVLIPAYLPWG